MEFIGALAASVATGLTAVHLGTSILTAMRQRRREHTTLRGEVPRVTVIRPLKGIEPFSHATLKSTFELNPAAAEILFCVESANDPIVPVVERLIAEHPDVPARLLIGRDVVSGNPKLNNLSKGWQVATCKWIAFIDSNVLLPTDALRLLMSKVDQDTGMVCSPPAGSAPVGFAAKLECAFLNVHQARWQTASDTLGQGFAQGKVMFFRRELIETAGGLDALGMEPAEDAAATKLVRNQGLRVRLVDRFFEQPIAERAFADVWARQVRWAKLRRASFPLHYCAEIFTGGLLPLMCTVAACLLMGLPALPIALAHFGLWYSVELALTRFVGWPSTVIYSITRDVLLPLVWVQAWLSKDFVWQGHTMRAERQHVAVNAG